MFSLSFRHQPFAGISRFSAVILALLCFCVVEAAAKSVPKRGNSPVTSLWKVSGAEHHFYLGGTMHVLKADDYPLPAAFNKAYAEAQLLVLEVDLSQSPAEDYQHKIQAAEHAGEPSALNAEAKAALQAYCRSRQIPCEHLLPMRVGLMVTVIAMQELSALGVNQQGVDMHFMQRALNDGMALQGLETMAQQLDFLLAMGAGNESAFLLQTLAELTALPEDMKILRKAWRTGDVAMLNHELIEPMKKDYPKVYAQLLLERNHNWLPMLQALAATQAVELVLVGAAHVAGPDGLLNLLKQAGYQVQQL